jgi:hypothetical protein
MDNENSMSDPSANDDDPMLKDTNEESMPDETTLDTPDTPNNATDADILVVSKISYSLPFFEFCVQLCFHGFLLYSVI